MTAGLWALKRLTPKLYKDLARARSMLAAGLADAARDAGVPLQVNAFGSLLTPFFTVDAGARLRLGADRQHRRLCDVLPGHAGARHLPAAVAVRGVVPVGGAHRRATSRRRSPRRAAAMKEVAEASDAETHDSTRDASCAPCVCIAVSTRRVDADAQDRALRQLDFLAFGRRDRAAAADQDAGERALEAAEDAADDRADAGAGADARRPRP